MKILRLVLLEILVLGMASFAADQPELKPLSSAKEYPSSKYQANYSLGAKKLSKEMVHKTFATDLRDSYVVVEVAVYPENGKSLDVNRSDFTLRVKGTQDVLRAAGPAEVAAYAQKRPAKNRDVAVIPTAGVVYENYPDAYGNRHSGVATEAGVGVAVGSAYPTASTDKDRQVMETELRDKGLPEGKIDKPVAGYLYFPVDNKSKGGVPTGIHNGREHFGPAAAVNSGSGLINRF